MVIGIRPAPRCAERKTEDQNKSSWENERSVKMAKKIILTKPTVGGTDCHNEHDCLLQRVLSVSLSAGKFGSKSSAVRSSL